MTDDVKADAVAILNAVAECRKRGYNHIQEQKLLVANSTETEPSWYAEAISTILRGVDDIETEYLESQGMVVGSQAQD